MFFRIISILRKTLATTCILQEHEYDYLEKIYDHLNEISDTLETMGTIYESEFQIRVNNLVREYESICFLHHTEYMASQETIVYEGEIEILIKKLFFEDLISFYNNHIWEINMMICEFKNFYSNFVNNHDCKQNHKKQEYYQLERPEIFKFNYKSLVDFADDLCRRLSGKIGISKEKLENILYLKKLKIEVPLSNHNKALFYENICLLRKKLIENLNVDSYSKIFVNPKIKGGFDLSKNEYYKQYFDSPLVIEYLKSDKDDPRFTYIRKLHGSTCPSFFLKEMLHNSFNEGKDIRLNKICVDAIFKNKIFLVEYFKYSSPPRYINEFPDKYNETFNLLEEFLENHDIDHEIHYWGF